MSTSSFSGAYNILTTFVLDLSSSEVTVIYTSTYNPFANSAPGRLYSTPVKKSIRFQATNLLSIC